MNISFSGKKTSLLLLAMILVVIVFLSMTGKKTGEGVISKFFSGNSFHISNEKEQTPAIFSPPEISGWIAWWKEADGFRVAENHSGRIFSLSPGWLKLEKNGNLVEIGDPEKKSRVEKMRSLGLKLFPMMVTDFSDRELAEFVKNPEKLDLFVKKTIELLKFFEADGLDLDFENIGETYEPEFSGLVEKLGEALRKNNLKFSVSVQAQTGSGDWKGLLGQNLSLISRYADEVRIMAYDRHGEFSDPGPVTPLDWFQDVLRHNLKSIPAEKIVIGLPTYGYVWLKNGGFESFQHNDFVQYSEDKNFSISRDPESFELKYENEDAIGWLSDADSVAKKIAAAREMGLNRFIIWNFGGTDVNLFEKKW